MDTTFDQYVHTPRAARVPAADMCAYWHRESWSSVFIYAMLTCSAVTTPVPSPPCCWQVRHRRKQLRISVNKQHHESDKRTGQLQHQHLACWGWCVKHTTAAHPLLLARAHCAAGGAPPISPSPPHPRPLARSAKMHPTTLPKASLVGSCRLHTFISPSCQTETVVLERSNCRGT